MKDYRKETRDFLERNNAKVKITFLECGKAPEYWHSNNYRNIYRVTVSRNKKRYTYKFHDSIYNTSHGIKPDEYDVLSCLTKYDVGTFGDFCMEYGYEMYDDESSGFNKDTMKIYKAILKELEGVERVFGDVLEEFAEICS